MDHLMSLKEAAKKWHVSESTVRNWCENNTINAVKIDGIWIVVSTQDSPLQNLNEFTIFGLEEAVNNFNNHFDVARLYFDLDSHFVWTAYFTNEDEMDEYNHISAIEIYNKVFHEDYRRQVSKEQILMLCYDEYLGKRYSSFDEISDYTPPFLVE